MITVFFRWAQRTKKWSTKLKYKKKRSATSLNISFTKQKRKLILLILKRIIKLRIKYFFMLKAVSVLVGTSRCKQVACGAAYSKFEIFFYSVFFSVFFSLNFERRENKWIQLYINYNFFFVLFGFLKDYLF